MKVLITGLPLFARQLAEQLSAIDPHNKYVFFDTYYSRKDKIRFLMQLPFCSHVISMNGVTDNSGVLNLVLRFKKKLVLQWMGTDSLLAMERYKNGTIKRDYIDNAVNLIDSQWLKEELESVEIKPIWQEFKFLSIDIHPVATYDKIHAVTYIAQSRQEFYGIRWVKKAAELFPETEFHVYGMDQPEILCPDNVLFFGWKPAGVFMEAMRNAPLFLRFTEHDGFSVSVIEALCSGAEVLATLPSEGLTMVHNEEELRPAISEAISRVESRDMKPNVELSEKSKAKWNKEKQLNAYINFLKQL